MRDVMEWMKSNDAVINRSTPSSPRSIHCSRQVASRAAGRTHRSSVTAGAAAGAVLALAAAAAVGDDDDAMMVPVRRSAAACRC
jgi:hypothetical protein